MVKWGSFKWGENMDKLIFYENNAWEAAREKSLDDFAFWVRKWEEHKRIKNIHGVENPFQQVYQEIQNIAYQKAAENYERVVA
jgi:hypothetical protein